MNEQRTYHSPFKRICVTDEGGQRIKELQEEFDRFWRKVNKVADKSPEKYHAMKAFQEACMWLTRGCALKNERVAKPSEHVLDAKAYLTGEPAQDLSKVLDKYQSGERIQVKNRPTIIIKKK